MVTPLRFRADTSSPRGKCRSIFLTGGVVSIFFNALFSGSSSDIGDLLIRLDRHAHQHIFTFTAIQLNEVVEVGAG